MPDKRAVIAEIERERKIAISNLEAIRADAQRHIDMLSADMCDRSTNVGHSIAQQETTAIGFATVAAVRHDTLLRTLRGEYGQEAPDGDA